MTSCWSGTAAVTAPFNSIARLRSRDALSEASFQAYGYAFRAWADRLTRVGLHLSMLGLPQQVDGLETARVALGYSRIDLLSQSAGTRPAMISAWRSPASVNRSVMIAVNPPGNVLLDTPTADEQLARFAE